MKTGEILKEIRESRNLSLRKASAGLFDHSILSRIETQGQAVKSIDLIRLLNRYNVEWEEFIPLIEDKNNQKRFNYELEFSEALRSGNKKRCLDFLKILNDEYEKNGEVYILHIKCVIEAVSVLHETNNNYELAREVVEPVFTYLNNIDQWYLYDLKLLNNILYFYEYESALLIGEKAVRQIENDYNNYKHNELGRGFLNNMAILSLDNHEYMKAHRFTSTSLAIPHTTKHLYSVIFSNILHQVSCFKLDNPQYDPTLIPSLLDFFVIIGLADVKTFCKDFVVKHGVPI